MKIGAVFLILWGLSALMLRSPDNIEKLSLTPTATMQRADLYIWKEVRSPKAVLVLCPGHNGNGEGLIRQKVWQEFAQKHQLGLVGLSFASSGKPRENNKGYYYASQGSGELLLSGLRRVYGCDLPILLYGFSGGAHFTSRFEEWKPDRVLSWCAYSAGWWDEPKAASNSPPGMVVCGDEDGRLGASLIYFKQGRAVDKPWLWVSVPKTGHSPLPSVESFIRDYFHEILEGKNMLGLWVDIDRKTEVQPDDVKSLLSVTAWLPNENLFSEWKAVHEP